MATTSLKEPVTEVAEGPWEAILVPGTDLALIAPKAELDLIRAAFRGELQEPSRGGET